MYKLRATSAHLSGNPCNLLSSIKNFRDFGPEENFTMAETSQAALLSALRLCQANCTGHILRGNTSKNRHKGREEEEEEEEEDVISYLMTSRK